VSTFSIKQATRLGKFSLPGRVCLHLLAQILYKPCKPEAKGENQSQKSVEARSKEEEVREWSLSASEL